MPWTPRHQFVRCRNNAHALQVGRQTLIAIGQPENLRSCVGMLHHQLERKRPVLPCSLRVRVHRTIPPRNKTRIATRWIRVGFRAHSHFDQICVTACGPELATGTSHGRSSALERAAANLAAPFFSSFGKPCCGGPSALRGSRGREYCPRTRIHLPEDFRE